MLPGYHSPYQRSLKMDNIINLTDDMYIGNNWTSTSDFLDMYADDVEADSPYSSPTFGAGEHCSECGAPVVGIIERYCVNPGCVNGEVSAKFAFIPHNKLNVGLRLNLDEMLNVIADQLGCDCSYDTTAEELVVVVMGNPTAEAIAYANKNLANSFSISTSSTAQLLYCMPSISH